MLLSGTSQKIEIQKWVQSVCILLDLSRNSTSLVLICKAPHPQVLAQDKQSILSLSGAESRKNIQSETML